MARPKGNIRANIDCGLARFGPNSAASRRRKRTLLGCWARIGRIMERDAMISLDCGLTSRRDGAPADYIMKRAHNLPAQASPRMRTPRAHTGPLHTHMPTHERTPVTTAYALTLDTEHKQQHESRRERSSIDTPHDSSQLCRVLGEGGRSTMHKDVRSCAAPDASRSPPVAVSSRGSSPPPRSSDLAHSPVRRPHHPTSQAHQGSRPKARHSSERVAMPSEDLLHTRVQLLTRYAQRGRPRPTSRHAGGARCASGDGGGGRGSAGGGGVDGRHQVP